jgi:hypothetical protein
MVMAVADRGERLLVAALKLSAGCVGLRDARVGRDLVACVRLDTCR